MKKYINRLTLKKQLVLVSLITIFFSFLSLVVILPNLLTPFYEKNIYEILRQPLPFIKPGETSYNDDVAYIIYDNNNALLSDNFYKISSNTNPNSILQKIDFNNIYGKIRVSGQTYYYHTRNYKSSIAVTLTNDDYIIEQKNSLNKVIIPIIVLTLVVTILILVYYSNYIVKKITKLKDKIDNIDNNNYNHNIEFDIDDELNSLLLSIENSRLSLIEKEQYKNNMFQNISHELKTPIMVISSHVEAANDKVIESDKALGVIKNEADSLSKKVSLILKLNKLNYLKNNNNLKSNKVNISPIINRLIDKYRVIRSDVIFDIDMNKENIFVGDDENWETIIDNILTNFIRFADKKIEISIKNKKIEFYNDGEPINKDLLSNLFEPYTMGNKGNHGLGLAIAKQTLNLFGYNIKVENKDDGVLFIIE